MNCSIVSLSLLPQQYPSKSSQELSLLEEVGNKTRSKTTEEKFNNDVRVTSEYLKGKTKQLDPNILVQMNLYNKYERIIQNTYNINIVSDLLASSSTHITTVFKDYLIYDDDTETLKESYNFEEAKEKMRNIKETLVIPNYAVIEERKYIFKNIKKKAKCKAMEEQKNENKISTILTKGLMDELVKRTTNIPVRNINKLNLAELVDNFIDRDSLSLINHTNCTNVKVPFAIPAVEQKKVDQQVGRAIQVANPLLSRKDVARISPISRTKGKARHTSQGYLNKVQLKSENVDKNDGRMTAIGYYPTKKIKVSKKLLPDTKQPIKIKEGELGKARVVRVNAGSALAVKTNKMSPKNNTECTKTYSKPKENLEVKKPKALLNTHIQSENRPYTSTLVRKVLTTNTINAKLKKIVTPKNKKGGFPSSRVTKKLSGKVEVGQRVVSALGNNSKKKLN